MPYLQFKGKIAVENYHHTVPHHTLEFDSKLSVLPEGENPSLDGNLIIEGDNLLALKALLPTHAGKIKCIYIDPPYNTGNEKWVYNDNLTQPQFKEWISQVVGKEGEDFLRHDKWCCMMYPRLQLLKELLREDGVIFVSIDDNEVANLRLIMDEIFGTENFVATFVWQKRYSRDNRPIVGTVHDYVLVYARNVVRFERVRNLIPPDDASTAVYRNPNNDPRGRWRAIPMNAQGFRKNQMYTIKAPGGAVHSPPEGRCWSMVESEYMRLLEEGRIWFGSDQNSQPNVIRYLDEIEGFVPWTWWPHTEVGHTDEAKKEIYGILGKEDAFDTPKPTRLIRRVLYIATKRDHELVLDCTAGSATTAHAVLQVNAEDGGNRRFILVQQPFDTKDDESAGRNIAETITAERVRRVIEGYDKPNGEHMDGLGGSFTYAKLSAEPLFGQYREMGDRLPPYEEIAKYVFYTETSAEWQRDAANLSTGWIGERDGTSYYLLYRPNRQEDWSLDKAFLDEIAAADPNKRLVVYCEKVWIHKDDLRKWQQEHGKSVRQMLVPFNLR